MHLLNISSLQLSRKTIFIDDAALAMFTFG